MRPVTLPGDAVDKTVDLASVPLAGFLEPMRLFGAALHFFVIVEGVFCGDGVDDFAMATTCYSMVSIHKANFVCCVYIITNIDSCLSK